MAAPDQTPSPDEFVTESRANRHNLLSEFWQWLKHNKKWWLLPILIVFLLLGVLVFLSSATPIAPFIYTVF